MHCFSRKALETYRESLTDPKHGPALVDAVRRLTSQPGYTVGGRHYKKIPRGYEADETNRDLLLHNGLYAAYEVDIPDELYSAEILDYCVERFKDMAPVHRWLVSMTDRAAS
jgi:hypothetical protein